MTRTRLPFVTRPTCSVSCLCVSTTVRGSRSLTATVAWSDGMSLRRTPACGSVTGRSRGLAKKSFGTRSGCSERGDRVAQRFRPDGLREVEIEARRLAAGRLVGAGVCGEGDDRTADPRGAQIATDGVAVEPRQIDVAQDEVDRLGKRAGTAQKPARLVRDVVSVALEDRA